MSTVSKIERRAHPREVSVDVPAFRANPHQSSMAPDSAFERLMDAGPSVREALDTSAPRFVKAPPLPIDAMMARDFDYKLSTQNRIERHIVANLLTYLERHGFKVRGVDEGDGGPLRRVNNITAAMDAVFAVDITHVYVQRDPDRLHWIFLVGGNGEDIVSDYSSHDRDPDGFSKLMDEFGDSIAECLAAVWQ